MTSFLLPCSCGQKLEVTAAQAGQRLTCACGREVDVPTLRGLQSLERTGDVERPAPRRWGARQGMLFLGTAIVAVAIVAAVGLEFFRPPEWTIVERLAPPNPQKLLWKDWFEPMSIYDKLTPAEVWLTWDITAPVGVDRAVTSNGIIADRNQDPKTSNWRLERLLAWVAGGIGVALIVISLLIPSRSVRRPTARKRKQAGATP